MEGATPSQGPKEQPDAEPREAMLELRAENLPRPREIIEIGANGIASRSLAIPVSRLDDPLTTQMQPAVALGIGVAVRADEAPTATMIAIQPVRQRPALEIATPQRALLTIDADAIRPRTSDLLVISNEDALGSSALEGGIHMHQRTFVLLKPDAVRRGLIGEILSTFERASLRIVRLAMLIPARDLVEQHYPDTDEWLAAVGEKNSPVVRGAEPQRRAGVRHRRPGCHRSHHQGLARRLPHFRRCGDRGAPGQPRSRQRAPPLRPDPAFPRRPRHHPRPLQPRTLPTWPTRSVGRCYNLIHASATPQEAERGDPALVRCRRSGGRLILSRGSTSYRTMAVRRRGRGDRPGAQNHCPSRTRPTNVSHQLHELATRPSAPSDPLDFRGIFARPSSRDRRRRQPGFPA